MNVNFLNQRYSHEPAWEIMGNNGKVEACSPSEEGHLAFSDIPVITVMEMEHGVSARTK